MGGCRRRETEKLPKAATLLLECVAKEILIGAPGFQVLKMKLLLERCGMRLGFCKVEFACCLP